MSRHEARTFGSVQLFDLLVKPFTAQNASLPEINLNPLKWSVSFNDFIDGVDYDATNAFTSTIASGGSVAMGDADHGTLVMTNDTTDDDLIQIQGIKEVWKFVAGKKLFFCTRFKLNEATQSEFIAGLAIRDTSSLDASDGTYFIKEDGEATYDFAVNKDTTLTYARDIGTLANSTYVQLAFYYDGAKMSAYVNGVLKAVTAVTNLCDDEELAITMGVKNGTTASSVMTIDYILVASER